MSKSVPHLFADVTALLEDLHGVAVEGQRRDNPPEVQLALAASLRPGIVRLDKALIAIGAGVGKKL
ncbi:hypothetical protein ACFQ1E_13020 [Sphingomonas canadensis]|uniref:Uncharacterized protein n=1 Tax=Sphingomonas canadensis TaxID=1219257 RepID=A0ABW3H8D8_9SPHN|nr:hypothetical protein [Sphingomonas canadensis]MCW3837081.1 hypothetical protein [Sphingomonas canadensis]